MKIRHSTIMGSVFSSCKDSEMRKGGVGCNGVESGGARRQSRSGSLGGLLDNAKMGAAPGSALVIGDPELISNPKHDQDVVLVSCQKGVVEETMPPPEQVEASFSI